MHFNVSHSIEMAVSISVVFDEVFDYMCIGCLVSHGGRNSQ